MSKRHVFFCCAVLAVNVSWHSVLAVELRTVALSGKPAPGTDTVFANFSAVLNTFPSINNHGQVAFLASLSGDTGFNSAGIWSEGTGALELVVRAGDPMPGRPASVFRQMRFIGLSDTGRVNFAEMALDTLTGVWSKEGSNPLRHVAVVGQAAPGTDLAFDRFLLAPSYNTVGNVAVWGSRVGLWTDRSGSLELVAKLGDIAPGTNGATFNGDFFPFEIDDDQIAFFGFLTGSGVNSSNNLGLWTESDGGFELVARLGEQAPGAGGAVFASFTTWAGTSSFPDSPKAFRALLDGSGGRLSMWTFREGDIELVVQAGDVAPGTGEEFISFTSPAANDSGDVVFTGLNLARNPARGIWSTLGGELGLVVAVGDDVPGMTSKVFALSAATPEINNLGQVAFAAGLVEQGIPGGLDSLWVKDQRGELHMIAREGDQYEVAPGDVREFSRLVFGQIPQSRNNQIPRFNDRGQLVFFAEFTDGSSGLFVSSPLIVPEPSSGALSLVVLFTAMFRRTRSSVSVANPN